MGLCNGPKWISVNILSGINIYCIKRYLTDVEPQKRRINNYMVWVVKCAGLSNTKGGLTMSITGDMQYIISPQGAAYLYHFPLP